ncbi:MAG: DUF3466 family protein [Candidatus Hydrogenedentes bacterium]|nr:DUF3466 family protein [Candidatus Hydrogenedentota bacterium]
MSALAAVAGIQAQEYEVVDIGTPGAALAVSDSGGVAGYSVGPEGRRAFLWRDGVMQLLGTLGGEASEAWGINAAGHVVGESHTGAYTEWGEAIIHAFLWDGETMHDLGTVPDGYSSGAWKINDAGETVGWSSLYSGETHAFYFRSYKPRAIMEDWHSPDAMYHSEPRAISNSGWIAGYFIPVDNYYYTFRAFLGYKDPQGLVRMMDLGALSPYPWLESRAFSVNNRGDAAGWAYTEYWQQHACLWVEGQPIDLNELDSRSIAYCVNDRGTVVGNSGSGSTQKAFVWDEEFGMRDLNALVDPVAAAGWRFRVARHINNRGWIVGSGQLNGVGSAFLLKPIDK